MTYLGFEVAHRLFAFAILGIDPGHGPGLTNAHLSDYCAREKITLTRSRQDNKDEEG